jgi:hypothetical protein
MEDILEDRSPVLGPPSAPCRPLTVDP